MSSSTPIGADLSVFTLSPVATSDKRWSGVPFRSELVVRARSHEDARMVAAAAIPSHSDIFWDDRFYEVRAVNYGDGFLFGGPRGLIATLPALF